MTSRELKKRAVEREPAQNQTVDERVFQSLPLEDCDLRIAISDNFDSLYVALLYPRGRAFLGAELVML